jgi:hypothetical protein
MTTESTQELAARREAIVERIIDTNGCCPAAKWNRSRPRREREPDRVLVRVERDCPEHGRVETRIEIGVSAARAPVRLMFPEPDD